MGDKKKRKKEQTTKAGLEKSCKTCDHDEACGGNDSGIFPCPDYVDKKPEEEIRHLCDTCVLEFATCNSNPVFGTGFGNDNVKDCSSYVKTNQQIIEDRQELLGLQKGIGRNEKRFLHDLTGQDEEEYNES
jgi:hypothetical protein